MKNDAQLNTLFALSNLYMARGKLRPQAAWSGKRAANRLQIAWSGLSKEGIWARNLKKIWRTS
jgi:hypothetical protein